MTAIQPEEERHARRAGAVATTALSFALAIVLQRVVRHFLPLPSEGSLSEAPASSSTGGSGELESGSNFTDSDSDAKYGATLLPSRRAVKARALR